MNLGRSAGLDGVRGWAAFSVAIFHCILRGGDETMIAGVLFPPIYQVQGAESLTEKILLAVFNGHAAVTFFFLLSGCVLIQSLNRTSGSAGEVAAKFAVKRVLRIYPASICAVLFTAALLLILGTEWPNVFRTYTPLAVVQNTFLYLPVVIGGTWTLRVEILFIPFFIVVGLLSRRIGIWAVIAAVASGFAVYHWPTLIADGWVREAAIPMSLGMLIPTPVGQKIANGTRRLWPVVLILAVAGRHIFGYMSEAGMYVHCVAAFIFVAIVYHAAPAALDRFLGSKTSQTLGRLSFSFYLFNYPLLIALTFMQPTVLKLHPLIFALLAIPPVVASGLFLAYFSEKYIERRSIDAGKRAAASIARWYSGSRNRYEADQVVRNRGATTARG
jgi:peptidoglycan/LPS O-acetylase OafA/YrhL